MISPVSYSLEYLTIKFSLKIPQLVDLGGNKQDLAMMVS